MPPDGIAQSVSGLQAISSKLVTLGIENDTRDRFTMLNNMDFHEGLKVPDNYTTVGTKNSDILTRTC